MSLISSILKIRRLNIHEAVTIFGRGFTQSCHHPIVETLLNYDSDNSLCYKASPLYRYHKAFIPLNTEHAMGFDVSECNLPVFQYPWGGFRLNYLGDKSQVSSRFCGPTADNLIQSEYKSTVSLYESIRSSGYKMLSKRSLIGGTFLINRFGERRFVVLQGNHRMSVLSSLGYKNVFVYTMTGYHDYIYESSVDQWRMVREGKCSRSQALRLFSSFFSEQGNFAY